MTGLRLALHQSTSAFEGLAPQLLSVDTWAFAVGTQRPLLHRSTTEQNDTNISLDVLRGSEHSVAAEA